MRLAAAFGLLAVSALLAGCGGRSTAAKPAVCHRLLTASSRLGVPISQMEGIPNSNADALRRIVGAKKATQRVLSQIHEIPDGPVSGPRSRLVSALSEFSRELDVARTDVETGRTQQQRSQGYVDAGNAMELINSATDGILSACGRE